MAVPPQSQEQHQQRGQGPVERQQQQAAPMESDRSVVELRALDCNLTALCEHIQVEGFTAGIFSDVIVQAMGTTYHLHRLILSRSSYFRFTYPPPSYASLDHSCSCACHCGWLLIFLSKRKNLQQMIHALVICGHFGLLGRIREDTSNLLAKVLTNSCLYLAGTCSMDPGKRLEPPR